MSNARDPMVDPQLGDEFVLANGLRVQVTERDAHNVGWEWCTPRGGAKGVNSWSLKGFCQHVLDQAKTLNKEG